MALCRVPLREKNPAEKKLDIVNQQISNANFVLDSLNKESVLVQENIQRYGKDAEKLKTKIVELSDRLGAQNKEIIELDKRSDDLRVTHEKRKADLKKLEDDIFRLGIKKKEEIDAISKMKSFELSALRKEVASLNSEIEKEKEELMGVNKEVEDKQKKYNELDEEVKRRLSQCSALDEIILKNKGEVERLNDLVESISDQLDNKMKELNNVEETIYNTNSLVREKENEVNKLKIEKGEVEDETEELKNQKLYLVKKEERLNELSERLKDLYKKAGIEINI